MKYHMLFLLKTRKDVAALSSAAVVIGALRVKPFMPSSIHMWNIANSVDPDKLLYKKLFTASKIIEHFNEQPPDND